jgi:hypothetical protein
VCDPPIHNKIQELKFPPGNMTRREFYSQLILEDYYRFQLLQQGAQFYIVLPGLLIACIAADAVTVLLLRRSILTEKVARHGHHILRENVVDPFELMRVGEVMDKSPATIPDTLTVAEFSNRIARGDPQIARRQGTPITDAQGTLVGIITRSDLVSALEKDPNGEMTVLEAAAIWSSPIPMSCSGMRSIKC